MLGLHHSWKNSGRQFGLLLYLSSGGLYDHPVAFAEPRGTYKRGYQTVELKLTEGRYDGEFADLAKIIRGEKAPDWGPEHDLTVHDAVLRASTVPGV